MSTYAYMFSYVHKCLCVYIKEVLKKDTLKRYFKLKQLCGSKDLYFEPFNSKLLF